MHTYIHTYIHTHIHPIQYFIQVEMVARVFILQRLSLHTGFLYVPPK